MWAVCSPHRPADWSILLTPELEIPRQGATGRPDVKSPSGSHGHRWENNRRNFFDKSPARRKSLAIFIATTRSLSHSVVYFTLREDCWAVNDAPCRISQAHLTCVVACSDDARLKQDYDAALRAWNFNQSSSINGVNSIDASSRLRRQLLSARLKAADDLYSHSVKCPVCKLSKVHLVEDEGSGHLPKCPKWK
jgi:hypothetical protein